MRAPTVDRCECRFVQVQPLTPTCTFIVANIINPLVFFSLVKSNEKGGKCVVFSGLPHNSTFSSCCMSPSQKQRRPLNRHSSLYAPATVLENSASRKEQIFSNENKALILPSGPLCSIVCNAFISRVVPIVHRDTMVQENTPYNPVYILRDQMEGMPT